MRRPIPSLFRSAESAQPPHGTPALNAVRFSPPARFPWAAVLLGFVVAVGLGSGRGILDAGLAAEPGRGEGSGPAPGSLDFNRDVRPILSQNCFFCHGPDEAERKGGRRANGGLRLDTPSGQREDLGGYAAVVPGKPEASALIQRLITQDADELMPPPSSGKRLSEEEIAVLRQWIAEGAQFALHWAYEPPVRPPLPAVSDPGWIRNGLDRWVLARLDREGLRPQPEADRPTLARRVALDLTGLPPTPEEVERLVTDPASDAYERFVDVMLAKPAYGEHWARMWLDLARYADSAGYADDPPRVIWPYRDYVIRAFNENLPFDRFTVEQLAGDLLDSPTREQLKATAFHRNTMTNSEGGTSDEEFRNVAVVDRVNTTFAIWMGTSMACAQCHTHKYDPISQKEYFQLFAFFNNTADADRPDEAPLLEFYEGEREDRRVRLEAELAALDQRFRTPDAGIVEAAGHWSRVFPAQLEWQSPRPSAVQAASGAEFQRLDDGSLRVVGSGEGVKKDTYTVELPFDTETLFAGLRLEALADERLANNGPGRAGNFKVRRVRARILPVPNEAGPRVRYVRIEANPKATATALPLAEVQVFSNGENIATTGRATQGDPASDRLARRAIDGQTAAESSETATPTTADSGKPAGPWWELDLLAVRPVERVVVWSDTEGVAGLKGFNIRALDEQRRVVWEKSGLDAPQPSLALDLLGPREVEFATAAADFNQPGLDEALVATDKPKSQRPPVRRGPRGERGWGIAGALGRDHALVLVAAKPVEIPRGATVSIEIVQESSVDLETLGRFRLSVTSDRRVVEHTDTPPEVLAALQIPEARRDGAQQARITDHFVRHIAPELDTERKRLAEVERQREELKPYTVPILRELQGADRRTTRIQLRGNFLATSDTVEEGTPAVWPALPSDAPRNRLTLARWLVSPENPLTARVTANRFWEQIFGNGIVRTSEEFGSQGELPVNPPLLDWLAVELREGGWDVKRFLKLLVTSAAYRQSSRVTPEALEKDPENRWVSRGPRFRLSAEMVRDQALAIAGILSGKSLGPSVRPERPNLDLRAAFGGNLDWQTSPGEDRHRRGLYTEWRRTSPYPSMAAFDAPNREVCTLRRNRSNTPLQALVTLNDPVYLEAARGLARRMIAAGTDAASRIACGYQWALSRPPAEREVRELFRLQRDTLAVFESQPNRAAEFSAQTPAQTVSHVSNPADPATESTVSPAEFAAWTTVAHVILNLDETLMKR